MGNGGGSPTNKQGDLSIFADSFDPRVRAFSAPAGALYIWRAGIPGAPFGLFQKQDNGLSTNWNEIIPGASIDSYEVKVTNADTIARFLSQKLVGGDGIALNILNPGADEDLQIVSSLQTKVSALDTTPGFLNDKIVVGNSMEKETLNPGADEDLQLRAFIFNSIFPDGVDNISAAANRRNGWRNLNLSGVGNSTYQYNLSLDKYTVGRPVQINQSFTLDTNSAGNVFLSINVYVARAGVNSSATLAPINFTSLVASPLINDGFQKNTINLTAAALGNPQTGDILRIEVTRQAANILDTYPSNARWLGSNIVWS